jgi:hypothetical protein
MLLPQSTVGALTHACTLLSFSGPIPQLWQNITRQDINGTQLPNKLAFIDLSGNILTGSLPAIIGGPGVINTLESLILANNKFTGRVSGHVPPIFFVV